MWSQVVVNAIIVNAKCAPALCSEIRLLLFFALKLMLMYHMHVLKIEEKFDAHVVDFILIKK